MAIESNDGTIDDEATADDAHDTIRPDETIRDTVPDLTVESVHAMRGVVIDTIDISQPPTREGVTKVISILSKVSESSLLNLRMDESDGKLTLAEYRVADTSIAYLYLHKDCKTPGIIRFEDGARVPIEHPGATVLLAVYRDGQTKEVYRWSID